MPRLPPVTEAETQAPLLEAVRAWPTEGQRAVLSNAMSLRHQEQEQRIAADEAEWAQQSLVQSTPEPLDDSKPWIRRARGS